MSNVTVQDHDFDAATVSMYDSIVPGLTMVCVDYNGDRAYSRLDYDAIVALRDYLSQRISEIEAAENDS